MNSFRKLRSLVPAAAVALLAIALVAPVAKAAYTPPLASTAQYKALVVFVDKLDNISGTPATAAQKAAYEGQLDNKQSATVGKSTALFLSAKKAAQAESQRALQTGVRTIRSTEAGELAGLRKDYDARMDRAATVYEDAVGRLEDVYDSRADSLRKQIRRLRNQKAKAEGVIAKTQIQETIDHRVKRLADDRKVLQEELADLKAGYRREKDSIRSAKASATRVVQQNDDEAILTLRNRSKQIYRTRVRTLQSRRQNQLGDLENKLNAGRAAIARIPVSS
jgi:predicted HicB family RNase H-like nuclease